MRSEKYSQLSAIKKIDIHHHYLPPFFVNLLAKSSHSAAASAEDLEWSPNKSVEFMDKFDIEEAILSLSLPGVSFHGAGDPVVIARQCNEYAAQMISDHPGRFGAFASLPILDVDAALAELDYALGTLKLDGVLLLSNIRGKYAGHTDFKPILDELDRRETVVFLHPNHVPGEGFNEYVEFTHDVSRAIASLTESGALERYNHIKYLLAYGGGTLPFIAARVTVVGMDVLGSFLKTMITYIRRSRTMKRMYYDLTATTDPFAWQALYGHTKPAHIFMGSNYPWTSSAAFSQQLKNLYSFEDLDLQAIEHGNAAHLFSPASI